MHFNHLFNPKIIVPKLVNMTLCIVVFKTVWTDILAVHVAVTNNFPYKPIIVESYRLSPDYTSRIESSFKDRNIQMKKIISLWEQNTSLECLEKVTVYFRQSIGWVFSTRISFIDYKQNKLQKYK